MWPPAGKSAHRAAVPKKPTPGGLVQFNARVAQWVLDIFEEDAQERMRANPGQLTNKSDLMRQVLTRYAEDQRAAKKRTRR